MLDEIEFTLTTSFAIMIFHCTFKWRSAWTAIMTEELFPNAQRIVDIFHLKENVYNYSKFNFGLDENKYIFASR